MASAQVTSVRGADPVAAAPACQTLLVGNRIVITGAGGQVGRVLAAEAGRRGLDVLALTSAQWDITDADAAERFVAAGDVVVNCAAFTAVDAAESEPERAHAVNAVGPGNVARACAAAGARMIHISTDYVFSGAFDGAPRPYDVDDAHRSAERLRQDQAGRRARGARGAAGRPRGADVMGVHRRRHGLRRQPCAGWRQATSRSTWWSTRSGRRPTSGDLVAAMLEIAETAEAPPLLHVANEGAASRFEQARAVFEGVGADPERVRPVTTEDVPRPARRPPYSALSRPRRDCRGADAAAAVA